MAFHWALEQASQNSLAYEIHIWLQFTFLESLPICIFEFNEHLLNAKYYGRRQRPTQDPWPEVREKNIKRTFQYENVVRDTHME